MSSSLASATFLRPGVWNNILIDSDVIRRAAPSVLGRFFMLGHPEEGSQPMWPELALGQVVDFSVEPDGGLNALILLSKNRFPPNLLKDMHDGEASRIKRPCRLS